MKKVLSQIILVYLTLFIYQTSNAYWWRFNNFTTRTLLLKFTLKGSNNLYYAIALPDESALFDWSPPNAMAGFCFKKVQWLEVSKDIVSNQEIVNPDDLTVHNKKMETFLERNGLLSELKNAPIHFFTSNHYKKTVKLAQQFGPKKLIKWFAKQYALSSCASRHIQILENVIGDIEFVTQKS